MGEERNAKLPSWTPTAATKLCDSCKSATALLFCRNDSAFLCIPCDSKIHAVNKLASRHARVWMCEVCEQAPAHVTCKADAAALCVTCDHDIHSANPLARRHERLRVIPFYDSAVHGGDRNICEADEAEAASWLMPNLNSKIEDPDQSQTPMNFNMYAAVDPYLDLEFEPKDYQKQNLNEQNNSGSDGVVPEHCKNTNAQGLFVDGGAVHACYDADYIEQPKDFPIFGAIIGHSISHSASSSSHEVGVVPDGGAMVDVSNPFGRQNSNISDTTAPAVQLFGPEREARVLRYREKRKNRKFEKTIRYASRKAYAEKRPRIKGRFAKRTASDVAGIGNGDAGYGVVPSY